LPFGIEEENIERDHRVFHPKTERLRLLKNEEHPLTCGEFLAEHETAGTFCRIIRNLDAEINALAGSGNECEWVEIVWLLSASSKEDDENERGEGK